MMKLPSVMVAVTLAAALSVSTWAQTTPAAPKPSLPPDVTQRTFYLNNVILTGDANEISTALRNLLPPNVKIFLVPSQSAIVVQATPDQLVLAQKLLNDLDRPKKTYRLTYTVTEMDGVKRIGAQHFAMVVVSGQKTTLRQNSRVPVATGSFSAGGANGISAGVGVQTQFTYLDVGINFDATLDEFVNGVRLRTNVDQSAVAGEKSDPPQQPVIRHITLEGASFLTPGKPLTLGSVDIPGSARHLDIEVVMEQLH